MAVWKGCLKPTSCPCSSQLQHSAICGIIVVTFTDSFVAEEWVLPLFSVCYGIKLAGGMYEQNYRTNREDSTAHYQ